MMKLYTADPSPFGRKVTLALHVLGLLEQTQIMLIDLYQPHRTA